MLSGIRILVSGLQFVGLNNILHPEARQYFSACVFQKSFPMKAKNSMKIENLKFHRQRIFLMRIACLRFQQISELILVYFSDIVEISLYFYGSSDDMSPF